MLKRKQVEKIFLEHTHSWISSSDPAAMKCDCGKWLISSEEKDRRRAEWDNYFELIRTTPSYLDWVEMKQAFKGKNKPKIKEILEKIKLRQDTNYEYLPKPDFPDPDNFPYIISN